MGSKDLIAGLRRGELASDHFTIIANSVARDQKLSCGAKGLFVNMASHKEGFVITEEFLASQCRDGVKTIRTLLLELREAGYIYRSEERSRYPKGTKNAKGKDIGGALGPYQWFVTDKPEEIAIILAKYAEEQRAANLAGITLDEVPPPAEEPANDDDVPPEVDAEETPGQDNVPEREVVVTSENAESGEVDEESENLPAREGGSPDQAKQGVSAGRDYLPASTGVKGSSKEDHSQKTKEQEDDGAPALRAGDDTTASGRAVPETSTATSPVVPSTDASHGGDHSRGEVVDEIAGQSDERNEFQFAGVAGLKSVINDHRLPKRLRDAAQTELDNILSGHRRTA